MVTLPHWTAEFFRDDARLFRPALEARLGEAPEEVDALLGLVEAELDARPETALDVACGIGRHVVELADRGIETTGVDLVADYVERARELAAERGVAELTSFVVGDMRDLDGFGTFDLVVNLWTSFGYFDHETNREVLAGWYDRLEPGGVLVMELSNREGVLAGYQGRRVADVGDLLYVEDHDYDPRSAEMYTTRQVFESTRDGFEHLGEGSFRLRLYTPVELADLLEATGFERVEVFETLAGDPLDHGSARMAVVALR